MDRAALALNPPPPPPPSILRVSVSLSLDGEPGRAGSGEPSRAGVRAEAHLSASQSCTAEVRPCLLALRSEARSPRPSPSRFRPDASLPFICCVRLSRATGSRPSACPDRDDRSKLMWPRVSCNYITLYNYEVAIIWQLHYVIQLSDITYIKTIRKKRTHLKDNMRVFL